MLSFVGLRRALESLAICSSLCAAVSLSACATPGHWTDYTSVSVGTTSAGRIHRPIEMPRRGTGFKVPTTWRDRGNQWGTTELVEEGELLPIEVEGLKGPRYIIAGEEALLDATEPPGALPPPSVAFLAPLDPIVWDRRLLRTLWGFDYLWEVYTPEHKRRFGYYVLPILFGDRLVGRIEPRFERTTKTLRILGLWWEDGISPRREVGLVDAVRDALRDYAAFVGATSVEWLPATGGAARLFGSIIRRKTYGA